MFKAASGAVYRRVRSVLSGPREPHNLFLVTDTGTFLVTETSVFIVT